MDVTRRGQRLFELLHLCLHRPERRLPPGLRELDLEIRVLLRRLDRLSHGCFQSCLEIGLIRCHLGTRLLEQGDARPQLFLQTANRRGGFRRRRHLFCLTLRRLGLRLLSSTCTSFVSFVARRRERCLRLLSGTRGRCGRLVRASNGRLALGPKRRRERPLGGLGGGQPLLSLRQECTSFVGFVARRRERCVRVPHSGLMQNPIALHR